MAANDTASTFSRRSVLNASALVFASSMILSLGGFAFHALASRKLGVDDYGALYALLSLFTLAVIPVTLLTPVVAKLAAEFGALHDDGHVRGLVDVIVKWFVGFGLVYILVAILLAAPLGRFLRVPAWEIPVVGIMAAVGIFSGTLRAIGQGVHHYIGYGLSMASEGIAKVAILAGFSIVGLTIFRGTLSFLLGMAVGALFIALPLVRRYAGVAPSETVLDWHRIAITTGGAAALTLTTAFVGFGDVLIVKHFFTARDAGLYSAVSLAAKIILYFVGFVPAVLIPQATHRHARGERTRVTLWTAVIFVTCVAALGIIAYRFGGALLLHALVGNGFDGGLPILTTYAGAMAILALTNTLGSYALATHRLAFATPLILAAVGTLWLIAVVHPSLVAVADELLLGNVVMLAATAIPLALQSLHQRQRV